MRLRTPLLALAAGTATFLLVAAAVSEVLLPRIEFSVFVGIPAGLAAGLVVGAVVFLGLLDHEYGRRYRMAASLGAFGAAALLVLLAARVALGLTNSQSLVLAAVGGVLAGVASYARAGRPAITRS